MYSTNKRPRSSTSMTWMMMTFKKKFSPAARTTSTWPMLRKSSLQKNAASQPSERAKVLFLPNKFQHFQHIKDSKDLTQPNLIRNLMIKGSSAEIVARTHTKATGSFLRTRNLSARLITSFVRIVGESIILLHFVDLQLRIKIPIAKGSIMSSNSSLQEASS